MTAKFFYMRKKGTSLCIGICARLNIDRFTVKLFWFYSTPGLIWILILLVNSHIAFDIHFPLPFFDKNKKYLRFLVQHTIFITRIYNILNTITNCIHLCIGLIFLTLHSFTILVSSINLDLISTSLNFFHWRQFFSILLNIWHFV